MKSYWLLAAIGLAGCASRGGPAARAREGSIAVQWTGGARGSFAAPARARWCAQDTLLEIMAVRNDTAVGLSLAAKDSLRAGTYPVSPAKEYSPGRPQAGAALRWLGEFDLRGYEASGGQVTVTAAGAKSVSGSFEVKLRPVAGNDSLRMIGTFEGLSILPAPPPCGRANRPGAG